MEHEHDTDCGGLPSGNHDSEMPDIDTSVLAAQELNVATLYRDLARVRAKEWLQVLSEHYASDSDVPDALAQGSDCLIEAVAHLEAAADLLGENGLHEARLRGLSERLLGEAAAFAHTADVLATAGS